MLPSARAPEPEYELELFVAGTTPKSERALRTLRALCEQHLPGRYTLTVVDLYQQPERASQEAILGVPMLLKKRPGLVRRLVGDFSDTERVLKVLNLQ
ncbi:circadian clock KaiB family protein [Hymenobacter sp. GOD-10R]|uniref:circadian clock KaiB family protein n=1 Tax=Hymenobacter sp. GOD-10R TaxID=3093922 RepID=UPI002D79DD76|nr:circadian clock KaiB family protein [Hymenobacter sp. GOD-10R]WRQ31791.1 circadian clock KaiB family protein [Hymenobacter sp. GOD-10R]